MIRPTNNSLSVYIYDEPVDMRKQMDGLAGIVEHAMSAPLYGKNLFVFLNKRRDKLKILCWEKNGFVVWYKRLEKERFKWRKKDGKINLSVKELNWLLDGYDVAKFTPHEIIKMT